jgi:malate/lactate dehydrogenase
LCLSSLAQYQIHLYISAFFKPTLFLSDVSATADALEAFDKADAILMLGAMPRKEGMLRKDLLYANASIFKTQGQIIDHIAKKSVKVSFIYYLFL